MPPAERVNSSPNPRLTDQSSSTTSVSLPRHHGAIRPPPDRKPRHRLNRRPLKTPDRKPRRRLNRQPMVSQHSARHRMDNQKLSLGKSSAIISRTRIALRLVLRSGSVMAPLEQYVPIVKDSECLMWLV